MVYDSPLLAHAAVLAHVAHGELTATVGVRDGVLRLDVRDTAQQRLGVTLGVTVGGVDLDATSRFVRSSERTVIEEIAPVSGKSTTPAARVHRELRLVFEAENGVEWETVIRLAEDGAAVRYGIPDLQGVNRLDGEATALDLAPFDRAWLLDYQTWYETPRFGRDVAALESGAFGLPVLLRGADDRYVLVAESGIDGRFSGAHAEVDAARGTLAFRMADAAIEIARGPITPWRVFILGDLAGVVESRLVDELAPARHVSIGDADWVRPGRAAWSWWSDFYSGAQLDRQKHFVDAAAQLAWEHLLIDCGWEETWVPEIVSYASRFGIQIHLWTVWHDLDGPEKLERLALWRSWGVAGIKVDFMESESKDRYRWYDSVLQETARLGLMVNFHGSVIPRGWARTWPQVVGYEAIRGSEYYVFYDDTPLTAAHNVIQPFTRNIVGAMDYTPVAFTAPGRATSDGHELGLSVAFECGITHFADSVDEYLARPAAARFLTELAPRWDETRLLAGTPDTEAVIARRAGDRWFLGCIATGPARTVDVPLDRLGSGPFDVWIVTDEHGGDGRGLGDVTLAGARSLSVPVARDGGFTAIVAPAGAPLFRAEPVQPEALPTATAELIELDEHGGAEILAAEARGIRVPPGWRTARAGEGHWRVQAPAGLEPGHLGVIAVEAPGRRGVPLVTPVRVIRPLAGTVALSSLPMLSFRNESGPVERDMSNGGGNPRDGRRMSIAGVEHDDGLGMSAPAECRIHLGGRTVRLSGAVGIDDETPATAATAVVDADGEELLRLDLTGGEPATSFDIDLRGRTTLTLRTESRSDVPAHIDWASTALIGIPLTQSHHPGH